jgi:hypothetical protein
MSYVEVTKAGTGQIIKVSDTIKGEPVNVVFVDLYFRLPKAPGQCQASLKLPEVDVELCNVRAEGCEIILLKTSKGVEAIGGLVISSAQAILRPEDAKELCERALSSIISS